MEQSQIYTKQIIGFDIVAIFIILLLPLVMIFFSHNKFGVFLGILFLAYITYGIVFIYNKLYRKKLIITSKNITYENKIYSKLETKIIEYSQIHSIDIKQTLFNRFINTGALTLTLKNKEEITLINILEPFKIQRAIERFKN